MSVVQLQVAPRNVVAKAGEVLATPDQELLVGRLSELSDAIAAMEEEKKSITAALIAAMEKGGDAPLRSIHGRAAIVRSKGRETFQVDAFFMAHSELAHERAKFTKTGEGYAYIRLGR